MAPDSHPLQDGSETSHRTSFTTLSPPESPSSILKAFISEASAVMENPPSILLTLPPYPPLIGKGQTGILVLLTPATALKVPRPQHEVHLANERAIYESLGPHPNILQYFGPLHTGLLFQYHSLGSLRTFILGVEDSGRGCGDIQVLEKERLKWASQIAEALVWCHGNGVVHCDTSSANTLITSSYNAVICDFSSSLLDGQRLGTMGRCSRWYKFIGAEGSRLEYGPKDDIWSLGIVVYEMWARRQMWCEVEQEMERVELYRNGEWPDLWVCGAMRMVVEMCWVDGYEDAKEVLADIRTIQDQVL